jgi:hypothetical protein
MSGVPAADVLSFTVQTPLELSVQLAPLGNEVLVVGLRVNVTVPVGVEAVNGDVSVTVTVQVVWMPWATGLGVHDTATADVRLSTVAGVVPELEANTLVVGL